MFLFFRIVADIFWNIKAVSIALNIVMFAWAIWYIIKIKLKKSLLAVYAVLLLFLLLFTFSLFQKIDSQSVNIFFKVFFSVFLFVIGLKSSTIISDSEKIAKFSIVLVLLHLGLSFMHIGYQYWGDVFTFSGLYFFKTDLALAMVISTVYILYFTSINTLLKYALTACAFYLIFISNARIHLLSSFLIIVFYFFRKPIVEKPGRVLIVGLPLLLVSFLGFLLLVQFMLPRGLLLVDLNNFYSESNTQGRSVIWETLLSHFNQAGAASRLFGMGLTADLQINSRFGQSDEVYNSHDGFLYLMISTGYAGCIAFFVFTGLIFRRFFKVAKTFRFDRSKNTYIMMFLSHAAIFYISNLSNVNLIFQQQTWFFFFWAGVLYNRKYLPVVVN